MKMQIDRLVLILFVLAMFFFMTVSAKAQTGNSHFFHSDSFTSNNTIELDDMTVTRSGYAGVKSDDSPQIIFGKQCAGYVLVDSETDNYSTTELNCSAKTQGVFLVYYARLNNNDLMLDGDGGSSRVSHSLQNNYSCGVKYFIISKAGSYTLSSDKLCKVYGVVFMPGNVAAYDVGGRGCLDLIGESCSNYDDLEISRQVGDWYLEGWYRDRMYEDRVTSLYSFDSPAVIYAKWTRCVWDFKDVSGDDYDGISVKHYIDENDRKYSSLDSYGFTIFGRKSTSDGPFMCLVPQYDGELMVSFNSNTSDGSGKTCVIGTALPSVTSPDGDSMSSGMSSSSDTKTVQAKLKKGQLYYIYTTTGNITITKLQYTAGAASAQEEGNGVVTLTTTENMQGWRAFYDAENCYTVDKDTKVYIVERSEEDDKVKFMNRTEQTIPAGCPVVLHTENRGASSYTISLKRVSATEDYSEAIKDNLLRVSAAGVSVNAYRLGYKAGEGYGVAFYQWSSDSPNAGVVYLDGNKLGGSSESAKIAFDIEEDVSTGVISIPNEERANNKVYSLSGQQLMAPVKGINIIKGKKIVVR